MFKLILKIIFVRFHGLLRLRPATTRMRLECLGNDCGKCCKLMGGEVVVAAHEAGPIAEHLSELTANALKLRSNGCACALLARGLCMKYDQRPKGCREYPWYNINNSLYYDAGCPGIKFDVDDRPGISNIALAETYYSALPEFLRAIVFKVLRRW
jgi:Fe-S-cluster containining protein